MGEEKAAIKTAFEDQSQEWQLGFLAGVALTTETLAEALREIERDILAEKVKILEEEGIIERETGGDKHSDADPGGSEQADDSPES
jgi:DNA-binding HxlR family transcriptional regulator